MAKIISMVCIYSLENPGFLSRVRIAQMCANFHSGQIEKCLARLKLHLTCSDIQKILLTEIMAAICGAFDIAELQEEVAQLPAHVNNQADMEALEAEVRELWQRLFCPDQKAFTEIPRFIF